MSGNRKPALYNQLKGAGAALTRMYSDYTIDQLEAELRAAGLQPVGAADSPQEPAPAPGPDPELAALQEALSKARPPEPDQPLPAGPPVAKADPDELPGQRLNTDPLNTPIRTDEHGRVWYQEEVLKPAYPKPRGRRILRYTDSGVETKTVQNGEYVETFEVEGQAVGRPAEIKITMPSYQVGIYKDPRFPFRIHCYNGREGFDLYEVQEYYGGPALVPLEIKRIYIENHLCYDIRTTIRTIQAEHRQMQLTGRL